MGGKRRRRRGSNDAGSGVSRRQFLAGSVLLAGGTGLVHGSSAFSQMAADRPAALSVAADRNALVGLDVAEFVDAGGSGQELVAVTNNTARELTVSIAMHDPSLATVSPADAAIAPGERRQFAVDVSADAPGGAAGLGFDVSADDGRSFSMTGARSTGVRNFQRNLDDRTRNDQVVYSLSYRVVNVDAFDRFEVTVRNRGPNRSDLPARTYDDTGVEGVLRIPASGSDGGAGGDEYEFVMTVYDGPGEDDVALRRTTTDVADGSAPDGNDDIGGGPTDPALESLTVTDNSDPQTDQTQFVVDYEASNADRLQEVSVTFDNVEHDWSDATVTREGESAGTVRYPEGGGTQGGTAGQEYVVVAEVANENGLVTDSRTVTDVADGSDP